MMLKMLKERLNARKTKKELEMKVLRLKISKLELEIEQLERDIHPHKFQAQKTISKPEDWIKPTI